MNVFSRHEYTLVKSSGEVIYLEVDKRPYYYKEKRVCVLSINDNTEYHKNIEIIKKQQEKIAEGERLTALGEMAAGIAHEINNPLFIIMGKIQTIQKMVEINTFNIEKISKIIDDIYSTSKRIANIVKGMKAISRNSEHDPLEAVNLKEIMKSSFLLSEKN